MLRLTKRADYGMMAMRYLAEHANEGKHSAKDIAEAYRIPPQQLAKIMQALARADLAVSHMGPLAATRWPGLQATSTLSTSSALSMDHLSSPVARQYTEAARWLDIARSKSRYAESTTVSGSY